jgi:hypothetical protein
MKTAHASDRPRHPSVPSYRWTFRQIGIRAREVRLYRVSLDLWTFVWELYTNLSLQSQTNLCRPALLMD